MPISALSISISSTSISSVTSKGWKRAHSRTRAKGGRVVKRRHLVAAGLAALLVAASGTDGRAQYPAKSVTIVVPLAAGTGMDAVVRIYAEELAKSLGTAVVVENQPGAAMMIATTAVARAAPDGHTLLVSAIAP